MVYYEIKKVFSRMSSRIALMLLLVTLAVTCWFAVMGVYYVNENGDEEKGITAIHKLREQKKEWAGLLTEERIAEVISENARINATAQAKSEDFQENDIAYSKKQGFDDIRRLLVYSYGDFNNYDYYLPDRLSPDDAGMFYPNRILHLEEWLRGDAKDLFTEREKQFLIEKYKGLETPLVYDYMEGWLQASQYAPTVIMITVLLLGFLTANIFSGEFQTKADAVFFSSYHGRKKAITAKIKAGFWITTGIYWIVMLLYSAVVLGILGTDGASCPIQAVPGGWKSFYFVTNLQQYLLVLAGGYIGSLFLMFLTMLISAKVRLAVVAVTVPFIMIFLPSFLSTDRIAGLLPDQLLQMNMVIRQFNLYELGEKVLGAAPILPILYTVLTLVMIPVLYQIYRRAQLR